MRKVTWISSTLLILAVIFNITRADQQLRVATLDWAIAETLLGLGITPIAVGDKQSYQTWVNQPALEDQVIDLGSRLQPNKELLATLSIQLFPNGDMFMPAVEANRHYLTALQQAPRINFYQFGDFWNNQIKATRQLAQSLDHIVQGEQLIQQTEQLLNTVKQQLTKQKHRPLLVVQFIDGRHLRVYGKQSLPGVVLEKIGLTNAWQQPVNLWGFTQIGIDQLAQFADARLIVIKPYPQQIPLELANNTLWKSLRLAKDPLILPAIWTFGALPSMQRFSVALRDALLDGGLVW